MTLRIGFHPIQCACAHDMSNRLINGSCSQDLALRSLGAIWHSRLLTTANRILRLYVATNKPSVKLKTLITFIIKVYSPMWFSIKCNPSCKDGTRQDGTRHVHKSIVLSRYLSDDILAIIDPVIHRNAYFGHCENVLLSMITDERPLIRELALCRILKARISKATRTVRRSKVPQLNFEASDYIELINRTDEVTEPPVIMNIYDAELKTSIAEKETRPCFSQDFHVIPKPLNVALNL